MAYTTANRRSPAADSGTYAHAHRALPARPARRSLHLLFIELRAAGLPRDCSAPEPGGRADAGGARDDDDARATRSRATPEIRCDCDGFRTHHLPARDL